MIFLELGKWILGSGLGPFGNKLLNCWIISVCRIHSCKQTFWNILWDIILQGLRWHVFSIVPQSFFVNRVCDVFTENFPKLFLRVKDNDKHDATNLWQQYLEYKPQKQTIACFLIHSHTQQKRIFSFFSWLCFCMIIVCYLKSGLFLVLILIFNIFCEIEPTFNTFLDQNGTHIKELAVESILRIV